MCKWERGECQVKVCLEGGEEGKGTNEDRVVSRINGKGLEV